MDEHTFLNRILTVQDSMFRMAKRLLISTEEAEDAVQEVVTRLWQNMHKTTALVNIEGYAMTMIKNYCLDRLKSKQAGQLRLVHAQHDKATASLDKQIDNRDSVSHVFAIMEDLQNNKKWCYNLEI